MASFRRVTENWKLKTLALTIAVLLWIVWSAEEVTSNWIPVPLVVEVEDPRFRAAPAMREVEVRFSGANRDLLDVAVRRPPLRLTIEAVEGQSARYPLDVRMIQVPPQLAVNALDVRPAEVEVQFTRIESKLVEVRPRVADSLPPGWYIVGGVRVEPSRIQITGPAAQIAEIREVTTEPIELTAADTAFERTVAIDTAGLAAITMDPARVTLGGRVDRVVERIVQDVRVDAGESASTDPEFVTVRLRGPERTVRSISPASFRVTARADDPAGQGSVDETPVVPVRISGVPAGVRAMAEPATVTIISVEADTTDVLGVSDPAADGVEHDAPANPPAQ